MTATFVGSRSAEDRRRRRLVAAADDAPDSVSAAEAVDPADSDESAAQDERRGRCGHLFPVRKLISPRLWKLWLVALAATGAAAALVYGGWSATRPDTTLTDAARRLLELPGGPGVRFLGMLLLVATGQLALLIYWVRSRSPRDFDGRYDIWPWSAAACFAFLVCFSTDAHLVWTEFSQRIWRPNFWNREVLAWFAPVTGAAAVLWGGLHRDMRRCRTSTTFLWLAAGLLLAAGALRLGIGLRSDSAVNAPAQAGTMLGGCVALFLALLFHARYVIFVCDEPPERRPSRLRFLTRLRLPGRTLVARWAERRRVARDECRAARTAALAARKAVAEKSAAGDASKDEPTPRRTRAASTKAVVRPTTEAPRTPDTVATSPERTKRDESPSPDEPETPAPAEKTSRSWFGLKRSAPSASPAAIEAVKPAPTPAPVVARKEPIAEPARPAKPEPVAKKPIPAADKPAADAAPVEKTSRSWFGLKRSAPSATPAASESPKPAPTPAPVAARKEPIAEPARPAKPEPVAKKPIAAEDKSAADAAPEEKTSRSWFGLKRSAPSASPAASEAPKPAPTPAPVAARKEPIAEPARAPKSELETKKTLVVPASAEPAPTEKSGRSWFGALRSTFAAKPEAEGSGEETQSVAQSSVAAKSSTPASAPSPSPAPRAALATTERAAPATRSADEPHRPAEARPAAVASKPPETKSAPAPVSQTDDGDEDDEGDDEDGMTGRIDGAHDREQFKGLSKRERRALRKQLKDGRRASRDGE